MPGIARYLLFCGRWQPVITIGHRRAAAVRQRFREVERRFGGGFRRFGNGRFGGLGGPATFEALNHLNPLTAMKKPLFTLALAALSLVAAAQNAPAAPAATPATVPAAGSYAELLGATITQIMNTGDAAELQALAAKLERAATVAPADWLPRYYQAYALVISAFTSKEDGDAKDALLDRAEAALAQARQLKGDESELLTLQAYAYQARLGISPMLRSMKYSRMVTEAVAQAKKANPANPRPYLVDANNVYYTPSMFGGGAEAAKPLYEEAKAKYAAFRPAGPLAPSWGQNQVLGRLKKYEVAATPAAAPTAAAK